MNCLMRRCFISWSRTGIIMNHLDETDLFLFDMKAADSAVHEKLTNSGNIRILDNLRRLVRFRTPVG